MFVRRAVCLGRAVGTPAKADVALLRRIKAKPWGEKPLPNSALAVFMSRALAGGKQYFQQAHQAFKKISPAERQRCEAVAKKNRALRDSMRQKVKESRALPYALFLKSYGKKVHAQLRETIPNHKKRFVAAAQQICEAYRKLPSTARKQLGAKAAAMRRRGKHYVEGLLRAAKRA